MDSIRVLVSNKFFLLAYGLIRNKVAGTVYGTANRQPRPVVFGRHKALSGSDAYFLCLGGVGHITRGLQPTARSAVVLGYWVGKMKLVAARRFTQAAAETGR